MWKEHLYLLVCPQTRRQLELINPCVDKMGAVREGILREPVSGNEYPIINYIPRFVSSHNYADSFGYQWNAHRHTQQDSYSHVDLSKERFFKETKWSSNLAGEFILEAGSGSGRFTTQALNTGAVVASFDYSNAVEANYEMNCDYRNLLLVQADIYKIPFSHSFFDKVFCFGVLQHTPDPHAAFEAIISCLKPGGKIATDIYWKAIRRFLHIKFWLRPVTKGRSPEALYHFVRNYVDFMWPLVKLMRRNYLGQKFISRFVADRSDQLHGADEPLLKEWVYLDTFDWLSPVYENPQTLKTTTVRRLIQQIQLV